jgi:hypothetical protein
LYRRGFDERWTLGSTPMMEQAPKNDEILLKKMMGKISSSDERMRMDMYGVPTVVLVLYHTQLFSQSY